METNKFGENVGELFGTVAWLWVFHRFRQDGMVLLGYEHPWEHGGHHDHASHSHGKTVTAEEATETWQKFSEKATQPGDDDDDDDDDDVSSYLTTSLCQCASLKANISFV